MSTKLLDPTLDVVFKMLLQRNPLLLRDMIEAAVELEAPIWELKVLNSEIPPDAPVDKGVALDIRVRLDNGHQIDLEMQSTTPLGTRRRFVYYWARGFVDSIGRGEDYTSLPRCISILWFKVPLLNSEQFHSTFRLLDVHSKEIFSDVLEFHVLELPKLSLAKADQKGKLERWARFLSATKIEELEALAREDATMNTAKKALEDLSMDPEARRIATARETAVLMHRHLLAASREAGLAEGEAKGLAEGEAKGLAEGEAKGLAVGRAEGEATLRSVVESLCGSFGIELIADQRKELARLDAPRLKRLVDGILAERHWPTEF